MPHQPVAPVKRGFARAMRREPTQAEARLWRELRSRRLDGVKFRRQVPIGPYVVDFVCLEAKLVVELDGSHHADSRSDERRTAFLNASGFRVLRFWNDEVLREVSDVCDTVIAFARDASLQPWR